MNIHLRTTYRGRMRDMKRILVVKAMVLGAIRSEERLGVTECMIGCKCVWLAGEL